MLLCVGGDRLRRGRRARALVADDLCHGGRRQLRHGASRRISDIFLLRLEPALRVAHPLLKGFGDGRRHVAQLIVPKLRVPKQINIHAALIVAVWQLARAAVGQ